MKIALVPILSIVAALSACGNDDETVEQQIRDLGSEAERKTQEIKTQIVDEDTREKFESGMNTRLEELRSDLRTLEKNRDSEPVTETREILKTRTDAAAAYYEEVDRKFSEFRKKAAEDWKIQRDVVQKSYDNAKQEINELIEKNKTEEEIQKKLKKINSKIDRLKLDLIDAKDNTKEKLSKDIEKLEEKNNELSVKFAELRATSKEKWSILKHGFNEAFDDLSKAFKDIFN